MHVPHVVFARAPSHGTMRAVPDAHVPLQIIFDFDFQFLLGRMMGIARHD